MTIQKTPLVYAWVRDLQIDEKYEYLLRDYVWCLCAGRPRTHNQKRKDGTRKLDGFGCKAYLHQLIMFLEYGEKSDISRHVRHLNHNPLDDRLENLAFGSPRENSLDHESHKGIRQRHSGKWHAAAILGGKAYHGRCRVNRKDAQFDYDMMAAMYDYHGILPKTLQERRDLPKYVLRTANKTKPYSVQKQIAGRQKHFGVYPTVDDAVAARDKLIANNWTIQ